MTDSICVYYIRMCVSTFLLIYPCMYVCVYVCMYNCVKLCYMGEEAKSAAGNEDFNGEEWLPPCMGEGGGVAITTLLLLLLLLLLLSLLLLVVEFEGDGDFSMVLIISKNKERSLIRHSYVPLSCT